MERAPLLIEALYDSGWIWRRVARTMSSIDKRIGADVTFLFFSHRGGRFDIYSMFHHRQQGNGTRYDMRGS